MNEAQNTKYNRAIITVNNTNTVRFYFDLQDVGKFGFWRKESVLF